MAINVHDSHQRPRLNHQKRVQFRPSCARVTLPRAAEVGVPGAAPDDEMKERAMMAGNLALFHVANMMTMEELSTLIHWFMKVISASKLTIFRLVKPMSAYVFLVFPTFQEALCQGIFVPQLPSVAQDERFQSRPAEFSAEAHGRSQDQNLRAAAT